MKDKRIHRLAQQATRALTAAVTLNRPPTVINSKPKAADTLAKSEQAHAKTFATLAEYEEMQRQTRKLLVEAQGYLAQIRTLM